jgi:hypothetical protein
MRIKNGRRQIFMRFGGAKRRLPEREVSHTLVVRAFPYSSHARGDRLLGFA